MNIGAVPVYTQSITNINNKNNSMPVANCTFKGLNHAESLVEKVTTKARKKIGKFFNRVLKWLTRPSEEDLIQTRRVLYRFNYINHPGIEEKHITNIIKVLDEHSQNPEYSDFVKEGIKFFQDNKNNTNLYYKNGRANQPSLDNGGYDARFTIGSAFEQAVRPDLKLANEETLNRFIQKSKEYMAAFNERGKSIYPNGFIVPR